MKKTKKTKLKMRNFAKDPLRTNAASFLLLTAYAGALIDDVLAWHGREMNVPLSDAQKARIVGIAFQEAFLVVEAFRRDKEISVEINLPFFDASKKGPIHYRKIWPASAVRDVAGGLVDRYVSGGVFV